MNYGILILALAAAASLLGCARASPSAKSLERRLFAPKAPKGYSVDKIGQDLERLAALLASTKPADNNNNNRAHSDLAAITGQLLAASKLDAAKCNGNHFAAMDSLAIIYASRHPHLGAYVEHWWRQQLLACRDLWFARFAELVAGLQRKHRDAHYALVGFQRYYLGHWGQGLCSTCWHPFESLGARQAFKAWLEDRFMVLKDSVKATAAATASPSRTLVATILEESMISHCKLASYLFGRLWGDMRLFLRTPELTAKLERPQIEWLRIKQACEFFEDPQRYKEVAREVEQLAKGLQ